MKRQDMDEIALKIDGKEAKGTKGDTILEVCKKNGVDVPTLCHFEGLPNAGSCRMCIVEIEGARGVSTACTTPAMDGMVVRTDTETLNQLRKETLQLLFAERNHFCMFCEASGDCELQSLAYRYQIDHFDYPFQYPKLSSDTSSKYFVLDHNRCVLCTRCVRACGAMAGADTLGVAQRSSRTMISVDLDSPLAASSCVSCGACIQVCPTGALFEKRSAYRGHRRDCTVTKSVCPSCGVGCGVNVVSRANNAVTVEGDFDSEVNRGLLCVRGRFQSMDGRLDRFTAPMVRRNGELKEASWEEALGIVASKLKDAGAAAVGVASSRVTNESLYAFVKLFKASVGSERLYALDSRVAAAQKKLAAKLLGAPAVVNVEAYIADLTDADCFVVVGVDPGQGYGVVDSLIRRAAKAQIAWVVVIDAKPNGLSDVANVAIKPKKAMVGAVVKGMMAVIAGEKGAAVAGLEKSSPALVSSAADVDAEAVVEAARAYAGASRPMIIYGSGAVSTEGSGVAVALADLALLTGNVEGGKLRLIGLCEKGNSRGAMDLGFRAAKRVPKAKMAFFMAGDEAAEKAPRWLTDAEFAVVQASYPSALTARADVVLPAPTWMESEGSFTSSEGRIQHFGQAIVPPAGVKAGWEVCSALAARMGAIEAEYRSAEEVYADIARSIPGYDGGWVVRASVASIGAAPVSCADYSIAVS